MTARFSQADVEALDRDDPLAHKRAAFDLPEGVIYLDGNSLGPLTHAAKARLAEIVDAQWGRGLIRSWNEAGWIDLPARVGARIAPLIGAEPGSVTSGDSTSVNLFKLIAVALDKRPERKTILTTAGNFPTDRYIAEGLVHLLGRGHRVEAVAPEALADAMTEQVALVLLTHIDYRSGARLDMAELTAKAHTASALILWDLAHSAGAYPLDLAGCRADFAVGCGYKYLNGGPGAPAFAYVAPRHLPGLHSPIQGWLGHKNPFGFADDYAPATSIEALHAGTPPILSLAALDAALEVFEGVDLASVKAKADRLFDIFCAEVEALCPQLTLASPRDGQARGTQISFRFDQGYPVMQALIARGVIGDFRAPDILRFGLTPLYLSHAEVWRAARILGEIMAEGTWREPRFQVRAKVS